MMTIQTREPDPTDQLLNLGFLSGALAGGALALGAYASDAVAVGASHVRLVYPSLVAGSITLVALGGLGGWVAAKLGKAWASMLVWLVTAGLMMLLIGHLPYEGRTLTMWLSDSDSWGLPIFPFDVAAGTGMALAGFFTLLLFGALGLVQPYRLELIGGEVEYPPSVPSHRSRAGLPAAAGGRLNARGWFLLLLPLPLVVGVGLINDDVVNRPLRVAPQQVYEAIHAGRTHEGDLFELSLERGVNYNAIKGVRDLMSDEFSLSIGGSDGMSDTVFVVADFDNGAWITCRVVADQLSFCYDATQPYLKGLAAVIGTGQVPEDCPYCRFSLSDEMRGWLREQAAGLGPQPRIRRSAQWGSFVQVEATSPDGGHAIECLFHRFDPVTLESCSLVQAK